MAEEAELVYRCYLLTPRYSDPILEIAPSKRFARNFEFLGIDKFDVIGETLSDRINFGLKLLEYLIYLGIYFSQK